MEGVGFEPTKAKPTDLQSAPVDRLGTPPGAHKPGIIPLFRKGGQWAGRGGKACGTRGPALFDGFSSHYPNLCLRCLFQGEHGRFSNNNSARALNNNCPYNDDSCSDAYA